MLMVFLFFEILYKQGLSHGGILPRTQHEPPTLNTAWCISSAKHFGFKNLSPYGKMGKTAGLIPFIPVPSSSPLESLFYWICNCSCWLSWLLTHLFVGISNRQLVTFHSFAKSGSTNTPWYTPWYTEKTSSLSRLCTPNLYFFCTTMSSKFFGVGGGFSLSDMPFPELTPFDFSTKKQKTPGDEDEIRRRLPSVLVFCYEFLWWFMTASYDFRRRVGWTD